MNDKNKKIELLIKAYSIIGNQTPLKFDCGKLCGSACCKSSRIAENQAGMSLLPDESCLCDDKLFEINKTRDGEILICNSKCHREKRPFACRIFPYYAKLIRRENGVKIKIRRDPRALSICPILSDKKYKRANIYFLRNVKKAVSLLISDKDFYDDFMKTSEFIDCLFDFSSKL